MKNINSPKSLRKPSRFKDLNSDEPLVYSEIDKILLQNKLAAELAGNRAKHEWKVIFFEKIFLSSIAGIFAFYLTFIGYKLVAHYQNTNNAQQVNLTLSKNALKEVWPILFEYEMSVNEMGGTIQTMYFNREIFKNRFIKERKKFDKEVIIANEKFDLAFTAIGKQQHLLGPIVTQRAFDYLRYQRLIASIYEQDRREDGKTFRDAIHKNGVLGAEKILNQLRLDLSNIDKIYQTENSSLNSDIKFTSY